MYQYVWLCGRLKVEVCTVVELLQRGVFGIDWIGCICFLSATTSRVARIGKYP